MSKSPEVMNQKICDADKVLMEHKSRMADEVEGSTQGWDDEPLKFPHMRGTPVYKYNWDGISLSGILHEWGTQHGIDGDLAFLVCASVTAHLAGPKLGFRNTDLLEGSRPPTLVAAAEDIGFQKGSAAALDGLISLQHSMTLKSNALSRKALDLAMDFRDSVERNHTSELESPRDHFYSGTSPMEIELNLLPRHARYEALVRPQFMLNGNLPKKPADVLSAFHLGTALASGEVENLAKSKRAREARIDTILAAITGVRVKSNSPRSLCREGTGSIGGIIRFMKADLEWLINHRPDFMLKTVPIQSLIDHAPVPFESRRDDARVFDYLRRETLRLILDGRRRFVTCGVSMGDRASDNLFLELRKTYLRESAALNYPANATAIFPDLLMWYLLAIGQTHRIKFTYDDKMISNIFVTARNLRRRVIGFYEQREKVLLARERLELAAKLVERMRHLGEPSNRRTLVRGFDSQRLDAVAPVIDSLVGIGFFMQTNNLYSLTPAADVRPLRDADFMEIEYAESTPKNRGMGPAEPLRAKPA